MNPDVEDLLAAEGAEMRAFAARLKAASQVGASPDFTTGVMAAIRSERMRSARLFGWLPCRAAALSIAASVVVLLALGVVCLRRPQTVWTTAVLVSCQRADGTFSNSSAAPYVQAFAVTALVKDSSSASGLLGSAVDAIVRDQDAEGGWANPSLSARNVVALRQAAEAGVARAARAYRRGRRYLQTHGIGELSVNDLMREAKDALTRIDASTDRGLACSVALCVAQ